MATTSGSTLAMANAASMPATTTSGVKRRCNNTTPMSARVPAPSPSLARASFHNRLWVGVKLPEARAWAKAVEPGKAPGLRCRISR